MGNTFAHSGHDRVDRSDWQELDEHLQATGELAAERGAPLGLKETARLAGLFHDFGKHDPAFDRVLCGEKLRVDHSTAGGRLILDRATRGTRPAAEILAYAILGHHAGLPDRNGSEASVRRRIEGFSDRVPPEVTAAAQVDLMPVARELQSRVRRDPRDPRSLSPEEIRQRAKQEAFDLSVAGRMVFSCLVDADYRDTEAFYDRIEVRERDRDWPALQDILPRLTAAFDAKMARFPTAGSLNRLRADILSRVRGKAGMAPGLFTLTVPTGGGKTLASMGFALDHAARHGHRRIIYAIPFTSVIDQTAAIFGDLFGDVVLEHHSAIDEEKPGAERRDKLRLAMEDWAAPIVVTTNVQLFESLFAARPSRCRKLHNIAGSVIVLDEAQCLPRKLLMPALRMLDALATHYRCSIVLCTATQPAFDSRQLREGGLPLEGRELAPDPDALARRLRRATIIRGGEMDDTALVAALRGTSQGMVIVNSRAHALELFETAKAAGLEGLIHLTTRQYPAHRRRIIEDVRRRLKAGEPCRLIATSLIEAGVDLDFPMGWRAEAGLDSCIQAAGRVNREGKNHFNYSSLTIFSAPGRSMPGEVKVLAEAMHGIAGRHGDNLLSPDAIRDWFEHVYWRAGVTRLGQQMVDAFDFASSGTDFSFRTIAEQFRMIESKMVPVITARDAEAAEWVDKLGFEQIPSGLIARRLQAYTVQIPARARDVMRANGKGSFHNPGLRADQFFVLDEPSLYRDDIGLWWESAEYLSLEASMI